MTLFRCHKNLFFRKRLLALMTLGMTLVFVLSALGAPQDSVVAGDDNKTDEKAEPGKVTADRLLDKAAEVQGGKEIATKFRNFSADFETEYYNKEKGQVYYQVKRIFQPPHLLWTEKKHDSQANPTREVYNGLDGWFIDAEGNAVVYTDKPSTFETDIANLEEDVRITHELFKYFFIARLAKELNDKERLGDAPVFKGNSACHVISGKTMTYVSGDEQETVYIKIYIDPKSHYVSAVRLFDLDSRTQDKLFVFEKHLRNRQDVLVPTRIKMYGKDEDKPEMKIFINTELGEDDTLYPLIDFNTKLDPTLFNVPGEEDSE